MPHHYHDLAKQAKENPGFRERVMAAVGKLGAKFSDNKKAIMSVLRASYYNMGFLLPWFFPKFGGKDLKGKYIPMSLQRRPFAFPMYALLIGGFLVIKGSRQIGKSSNLTARQLGLTHLLPPWVSFYIAPHTEHIRTYSTRLREMEQYFRYNARTKGLRNNLYLKEYRDGSRIEIHRVLTSAAHMRGKTCDEINYDEYQHFDVRLEAETSQMQRVSETPITIYSGTSTTVDSPLEVRFSQSSGGVWMMRSPNGKDFIDCSDPTLVLKMLRPNGLTCPYTERLITDPLNGEYAHARPHLAEQNIIGIHVPQFIIPDFIKPTEWHKIFNYLRDYGETRTLQEVAGIAVEEGNREITQKDLIDMCNLDYRGPEDAMAATIKNNRYRFIVSGCDWGGSDYQMARQAKTSYTVHVILGVNGDGTMDILHMRRHAGMDYDEIASLILKDHLAVGGTAISSDYGAGYAYNTFLHRDPRVLPTRHFVWEYNAPYMPMVKKPAFQQFPTHFLLNKTESITQLFEACKKGRIRCYSWDRAQTHLSDMLNSFRVLAEKQHGRQYFLHIRNAARPDDTLHALNFAFVAARLLLKEPMFDDPRLRDYVYDQMGTGGANMTNLSSYGDLVFSG